MAEPGGNNMLYGVVICDALDDPSTTTERLTDLRESARGLLDAQGDLPGALEKLEAEIARRGG